MDIDYNIGNSISNIFFNQNLTAKQIIHIGTSLVGEWGTELKDFFELHWEYIWPALKLTEPDIKKEFGTEDITKFLINQNKLGFLILFSTPILTESNHRYTTIIYSDTYPEACVLALKSTTPP